MALLHDVKELDKKSGLASKALDTQGSWKIVISMKMNVGLCMGLTEQGGSDTSS